MNALTQINTDLYDKRLDIKFNPDLLNELDYDSRHKVEKTLLSYCKQGIETSFKYLQYFNTISEEDMITEEDISKLSLPYQVEIYRFLFLKSKNLDILNKLINLSMNSYNAFYQLLMIYNSDIITDEEKEKIKLAIDKSFENNKTDINYKFLIDNYIDGYDNDDIKLL